MNLDVIRRLLIKASVEGADSAASSLRGLATAQGGVTVASDKLTPATLGVDGALKKLRMSVDEEFRAEERLSIARKTLGQAQMQGLLGPAGSSAALAEQNRLLDLATAKYKTAGESAKGFFSNLGVGEGGAKALLGGLGIGLGIGELMKLPGEILAVNHEIAGLGHSAELIGITTKALQGLVFAGKQVDISTEAMDGYLENFAKNIGLASQGTGDLSKVLRLNHVQISGDFMTDLRSVANLIEHAKTAEDRATISTQAFGKGGESMGLLFVDGAAGIDKATAALEKLGGVHTDDQIQKAKDLDAAWINMKADIDTTFQNFVLTIAPAVVALLDQMTSGLKELAFVADNIKNGNFADAFGFYLPNLFEKTREGLTAVDMAAEKVKMRQFKIGNMPDDSQQYPEFDRTFKEPLRLTISKGLGGDDGGGTTKTYNADDARLRKQFDDAVKAADKQTAALKAQAAAFGLSSGAAAEYEKRQELLNLATANHLKLSDADRANIDQVAEAYGEATQKLAEMKVQSDLLFDAQQLGRSAIDQQVASTLRGLYGNEYQQYMDGAIASQIRFNEALKDAKATASDMLSTFVSDLRDGKSFVDGLSDSFGKLQDKLIEMAEQKLIDSIFQTSSSGGSGSGIWSFLASLFGGGAGAGAAFNAHGLYHSGGIVGQTAVPTRYIHPAYFDDAPRFHGGLEPDEFPAILQRGERVIPRSQVAASYSASPRVEVRVSIVNQPGIKTETEQRPDGSLEIRNMLDQTTASNMTRRGTATNQALRMGGAKPPLRIR